MSLKRIGIIVLCTSFLLFPTIKAQGNLPFADEKTMHFGFSLGLNLMDFEAIPTSIDENVNVTSIIPGFSVGAISDLRLSRYMNLRFTPTLMLNQRNIHYTDESIANLLSIPFYMPVYLKYSSERITNFRPYLIAGGGVWVDWGRDKEKTVLLKPFDALIEAGFGCSIYFPFFRLSPELKFSFGFNNMLTPLDERDAGSLLNPKTIKHTESINKLTTRMISLTFNFE
ncbi:MAG: PorT family protein [Bacteroidales bacterium]|nr:PorT family protein [Bacteroidales bacterium]